MSDKFTGVNNYDALLEAGAFRRVGITVEEYERLAHLKSIEQRMGIDFATLYLLLEKQETEDVITIYYKDSARCKKIEEWHDRIVVNVRKKRIECISHIKYLGCNAVAVRLPQYRYTFDFCEFGKTWAFDREALE